MGVLDDGPPGCGGAAGEKRAAGAAGASGSGVSVKKQRGGEGAIVTSPEPHLLTGRNAAGGERKAGRAACAGGIQTKMARESAERGRNGTASRYIGERTNSIR